MKKDIQIPKVTGIFMAIVKEYNSEFQCDDWNAYIINNKNVAIELVLIVSKGYDKAKRIETAILRHKIEKLPAKSYAKVELLLNDVIKLSNVFDVTFFEENMMYDKKFLFKKGSIKESDLHTIPLLNRRGILIK
ncbi:hypothetical protein [Lutibacter sp.]|uniref:hypothetical protein n=1 Tax=Lutibacter sp. TaxID=1925666 RepID=UPI0025BA30A7|nr:hypothetical protein [Lutibacter sp.]MCF6168369.1 hypothetical protein [Lutibacter sp.]